MIIVIYYYIAIVLQYCPQNPRSTLQVVLCGELLRDSRGRFFLQPSKAPKVGMGGC